MCGVAGFVGSGGQADLRAMTDALAHRGPDGDGFLIDSAHGVHLGHRRLAILDLALGDQPMYNEDRSVAIVFNGEIYNHAVLRSELEDRGHRFRSSHSDTEVLVHGYEEWGLALAERLNGMFAFVVYDSRRRRLLLARDRCGEKPLYYTTHPDFFGFASELGALSKHSGFKKELDPRALQKYFAHGYIPAPLALYRTCYKLSAGCQLTYDLDSRATKTHQYWDFRIEADESLDMAATDVLAEELRHLLLESVERRLESDVPLGIFLSGGVDSSAVLALAAKLRPASEIQSFTIGFTEPSYDESSFARLMARHVGSIHREKIFDADTMRDLMPGVLARMDEPLGDASILPTYLLSSFTREHVTVALSGDGGDELFAGYDPFSALGPARIYNRLVPQAVHRGVRRLASFLPISSRNMSFDFKVRRALAGLSYPEALWNPIWLAPLEPAQIDDLFETPVDPEDLYEEALNLWNQSAATNAVDRSLEFYTKLYLQNDILTKVDRASMMVSLESRAVFLDNHVLDFCRRLPHRFKLWRGERKYLLKRALQGLLPSEIIQRTKKGFGIPLVKWLQEEPAWALEPVPGVDMAWAAQRWRQHRMGTEDARLFLFSWLGLQATTGSLGAGLATPLPSRKAS